MRVKFVVYKIFVYVCTVRTKKKKEKKDHRAGETFFPTYFLPVGERFHYVYGNREMCFKIRQKF